MIFYFVRHGESVANVERIVSNRGFQHPLTEKGLQQAKILAETMKDIEITQIYTSPLQRAVQTAEILGESKNIKPVISDALREGDCGVNEGRSDPEVWEGFDQLWAEWVEKENFDACFDGGESFNDLVTRFVPFIEGLIKEHADTDTIVCVAHGMTYVVGLSEALTNVDLQYTYSHGMGNTSYVKTELTNEGLVCLEWCGNLIENK